MNKEQLIEKLRMIINACDGAEDHLLNCILKLRETRNDALSELEELENDE